jgi:hypothetical protein
MQPANFASRRKCAFESGEFSTDNWMCATMGALRDRAVFINRDDMQNASIAIVPMPDGGDTFGYVVLTYYKDRGAVGRAVLMNDGDAPKVLAIMDAESLLGGPACGVHNVDEVMT